MNKFCKKNNKKVKKIKKVSKKNNIFNIINNRYHDWKLKKSYIKLYKSIMSNPSFTDIEKEQIKRKMGVESL